MSRARFDLARMACALTARRTVLHRSSCGGRRLSHARVKDRRGRDFFLAACCLARDA
jgi:hypothetical protein